MVMRALHKARAWLAHGASVVDLAIRLLVAEVFFRSGLVKIGNWDGTLYLFRNEYRVPLLSPDAAAWLGTFGELAFPPLLALGLAARFAAASLFILNAVAVVSFWHVLAENDAARASHLYWAILLLVTLCHGPGKLSIDHFIERRFGAAPRPALARR
ncbi:MAG: DoxX family protein [Betaproteobacteria bacterium]